MNLENKKKKLKKSSVSTQKHICEFCGKQVVKKDTLIRHYENCQVKMRHEIRSMEEVQIAYKLWKSIQIRIVSIEQFEKSNLYKTFLDFVVYTSDNNYDHILEYGYWLLKNKISVYHWKKNKFYQQFLTSYINDENPRDAILRSISNIEDTGKYGSFFSTYPVGTILTMIEAGKISPWLIILSEGGNTLISRLSGEKIDYFCKLINIDRWQKKKSRYPKICSDIIKELEGIEI